MALVNSSADSLSPQAINTIMAENLGLILGVLLGLSCILWCIAH